MTELKEEDSLVYKMKNLDFIVEKEHMTLNRLTTKIKDDFKIKEMYENKRLVRFEKKKLERQKLLDIEENLQKIKSNEIKKENIIPLFNPKLNLLPVIILYVECDCIINEDLYDKIKEEIAKIIDKKNFIISEIQRGSGIIKTVLINELAKIGIKASTLQQNSKEINSIIEKLEKEKFVCLGNNSSSLIKYNIPDYSKEENRKELVNFLKENSKENEDIFQATSTISNEDFFNILDKGIEKIEDPAKKQEINQKKFILNQFEEFNKQIESILEEKKKDSIFEFSAIGLSLIHRNKEEYENNKKIAKI